MTIDIGTIVDTEHGRGTVVDVSNSRMGATEYQVEGDSFKAWAQNPTIVKQADWKAVQDKGRQMYESGMVEIEQISIEDADGVVTSPSGRAYYVHIERMTLEDDRVKSWDCDCDWTRWLPKRKTLKDQPCSHAVALMYAAGFDQIRANREAALAWERDNDGTLYTSSPKGVYYRVRKNNRGTFDVETSRSDNGKMNSKRNLKNEDEAIAWAERKGKLRQMIAGKNYTLAEQQELIDEDGFSENSIARLDLKGTHYDLSGIEYLLP